MMARRLLPCSRSFWPPPSSCRTRCLCQDACTRRWTPLLVIHNCISDFVALSLHHCISDFVASSLHHCISDFVASSLHHCISEFVASSLRRFVASSLRRFVASLHLRFCGLCGVLLQLLGVSRSVCIKVRGFCGVQGVKVRGFCCVRGIKVWGSSGCQGPGFLPGGSVVFGVSMSVGVLVVLPLLGSESDALGAVLAACDGFCSGSCGAGGRGARCGVPRRARASPAVASPAAASPAGTAVFGDGVESGGQAAGSGPSHKFIGHLHHFGMSQRLRRFMSCHFCLV
jgi:hypothetical protein